MKQSRTLALVLISSLGLGIATTTAHAHPGQMGDGTRPHAMGGMPHGMMGGMGHGVEGGLPHDGMGGGAAGHGAGNQLMTPEERTALVEKMRNARTPEERQQIAAANHAEMQKRATEKGITLPGHRGPHAGSEPRSGVAPQSPGATENAR